MGKKNSIHRIIQISLIFISIVLNSCNSKTQVDLIVYNAKVYTVDSASSINQAFAIKDGIFVEIASNDDILGKYISDKTININNRPVYPGFIDAHCHFIGYAEALLSVDLFGTQSWDEVLDKCKTFNLQRKWLIGRGWDQNDWNNKAFPNKEKLDSLFPNTPVYLTRIDGHAAIVNSKALELAGITTNTVINGGAIVKENGVLTGVLIDNAMELVKPIIPEIQEDLLISSILNAQENLLTLGITAIHDAGLDKSQILLLDKMYRDSLLELNIYAMISASHENFNFIKDFNPYSNKLKIKGVKVYSDGALGSRGALLTDPYSDDSTNYGLQLIQYDSLENIMNYCYQNDLQVNTHCIGDSAASLVLELYEKYLKGKNDRRWRIEHAQVINPMDYHYFSDNSILPSVQPTHATSDMPWAEHRLGARIDWAYSYSSLEKLNGILPLGTDFPIENISPFFTFYSAISRKDHNGLPKEGFLSNEILSREKTLKGMTSDAAFSGFTEQQFGSIEQGKLANFIILSHDIMTINEQDILKVICLENYINGKRVYNLYLSN